MKEYAGLRMVGGCDGVFERKQRGWGTDWLLVKNAPIYSSLKDACIAARRIGAEINVNNAEARHDKA